MSIDDVIKLIDEQIDRYEIAREAAIRRGDKRDEYTSYDKRCAMISLLFEISRRMSNEQKQLQGVQISN